MKQPSREADAAAPAGFTSLRVEGSYCPNSDAYRERARKGVAMNAWFPCYANDLLGSMRWKMMTAAQRGAYWQLICWQMQAEDGHLPADLRQLSALADLELADGDPVVAAFPVQPNGKRANPRALRERERQAEHHERLAEASRKGNEARWGKASRGVSHGDAQGNPPALPNPQPHPQPYPQSQPEGTGDARGADAPKPPTPAKSFKTWTDVEFREQVEQANADNLLTPAEVEDFIGYWQEKSASGRVKRSMERTWDTRRRMQTALRVVYENRRNSPSTTRGLIDWDKVRTEGNQ